MTTHDRILRYVWAGLHLRADGVYMPNGTRVQAVRSSTLAFLIADRLVVSQGDRYVLTDAGREAALTRERVREFAQQIAGESLGTMVYSEPRR